MKLHPSKNPWLNRSVRTPVQKYLIGLAQVPKGERHTFLRKGGGQLTVYRIFYSHGWLHGMSHSATIGEWTLCEITNAIKLFSILKSNPHELPETI